MLIETQIIQHPYFPFPTCRAEKYKSVDGTYVRWYDLVIGEEYPPYFGYDEDAVRKIEEFDSKKQS